MDEPLADAQNLQDDLLFGRKLRIVRMGQVPNEPAQGKRSIPRLVQLARLPQWIDIAVLLGEAAGRADRVTRRAQRQKDEMYKQGEGCQSCSIRAICDGFTNQYVDRFGMDEVNPYTGQIISNPAVYIAKQLKLIEIPVAEKDHV